MQPLSHLETIKLRLDTIEFLLSNETLFFDLSHLLSKFGDIDRLYLSFVQENKRADEKAALHYLNILLQFKKTLEVILELKNCLLKHSGNAIFDSTVDSFSQDSVQYLLVEIAKVLGKDRLLAGKQTVAESKRNELVFAVEIGVSALLDVARATYLEVVNEIRIEVDRLRIRHPDVRIKLVFSASHGYRLSLAAESLPAEFISIVKSKRSFSGSTVTLSNLNDRCKEAYVEVLLLTSSCILNTLNSIRRHMHMLVSFSEAVSIIDFIWNLAYVVTVNNSFVRPEFAPDGPIVVIQGRHPVLESSQDFHFVPNDSNFFRCLMVTGPNGSGKSTFLRQLVVIQVMAQIGSFVPAQSANLRLVDQIFVVFSQDVLLASSSFLQEMGEIAISLRSATSCSLVVVDELGRSTSNSDAVSLCFSIFEHLILRTKSLLVFSTHLSELKELRHFYREWVEHVVFRVELVNGKLVYSFKMGQDNDVTQELFAIEICKTANFPPNVISHARSIAAFVLDASKGSCISPEDLLHERLVKAFSFFIIILSAEIESTYILEGQS